MAYAVYQPMKYSSYVRWLLFTVAAAGGASTAAVAGCSSDDPAVQSGPDGSTDGKVSAQDAPTDTRDPDATVPPQNDASLDAGVDADADARDSSTDAQADSGPALDAGPPVFERFSDQINQQWCRKLARCCGPDTFDYVRCESDLARTANDPGPALNRVVAPYLFDGGNDHITWDPAKAQTCFNDIDALACGNQNAEVFKRVHEDCLAAVKGNVKVGESGCRGSPECAPSNHCDKPDGAATGVCVAPRALDAGCDLGMYEQDGGRHPGGQLFEPQAQCGYLVTGSPRYCANPDTYAGRQNCANPSPRGTQCFVDVECASNICMVDTSGTGTCADSKEVASAATCAAYRKP